MKKKEILLIPMDRGSVEQLFKVAGMPMPKDGAINYLLRVGLTYCAGYLGWTGKYKRKKETIRQWLKRTRNFY
jgi:hypothetical protein